MSQLAIQVSDVTKSFGRVKALDGVNLSVPSGMILALLGPNGAGKTTLVRILTTLLRADSGQTYVSGYDVVREASTVRSLVGLAGQYPAVDEILTGRENLEMVGRLYHMGRTAARNRADELLDQFALKEVAGRRVKTYSGGLRRRLDLAASIVSSPRVLFLDEPTTGLDPRSRLGMWDVIRELTAGGTTVFLSTQYLEEADRLADSIAVLDSGRIIREGTSADLKGCCGGDVFLELQLPRRDQAEEARDVLENMAGGKVQINTKQARLSMPLPHGTVMLADVVRRLDERNISISDLTLRQPTLDDVFLAITGRPAEPAEQPESHSIDRQSVSMR
ncbi:MAG: ATP-binding cassette domain-containing protein [Dehalococcoidia bacterium]